MKAFSNEKIKHQEFLKNKGLEEAEDTDSLDEEIKQSSELESEAYEEFSVEALQ
eukprot:CAMPEP_0174274364 /NCGR_PEP_ID=MMETSP0439-20130205/57768_1 /TAXON_ID=0 /ORGANISM="Stereomyxa ramosa, Strain Chinc5" /LENGTH=53 /DNA_ID=CAMNT_0015366081 /DNA_START=208 /DNA_END=366 /DNA_ORIENTATION=-